MPRWFKSFRIRLALLTGGISLSMILALTAYINHIATDQLTADSADSLHRIGKSIANALAANISEREREIILLSQSPLIVHGNLASKAVRDVLNLRKQTYQDYAWLGVTNVQGIVQSAADGLLENNDVSQRPWFIQGQKGTYLGDAHEAVLLARLLKNKSTDEPLRFIDFASPVHDSHGRLRGVLAAHAHWSWVSQTIKNSLPATAAADGIEALIINQHGAVLYPYNQIGKISIPEVLLSEQDHTRWIDNREFLATSVTVKSNTLTNLGWHIVVRQPVDQALALVTRLHRHLLSLGLVSTLIFMLLTYWLATSLSRPVEYLSNIARFISQGRQDIDFPEKSDIHELDELSDALRRMTHVLLEQRQELETANVTLENRVHERTQKLRAANQQLLELARRDALTGLGNRLSANELLHDEFLRMKRSQGTFSVLMLDIDHFKRVNDTYGHSVGDSVLKEIAALIKGSSRASDFVCRYGGEEFLVILPHTSLENALIVAEKIRASIAESHIPTVEHVTTSIGVAMMMPAHSNAEMVVNSADHALYQAKAAGRNRVVAAAT